jgi:hypothetical protein
VPPKDSDLAALGRQWLGVDIETGELVEQFAVTGIDAARLNDLTTALRYYGFHATVKPPFKLAPHATLERLVDTIKIDAEGVSPIEIPPLEIAVMTSSHPSAVTLRKPYDSSPNRVF